MHSLLLRLPSVRLGPKHLLPLLISALAACSESPTTALRPGGADLYVSTSPIDLWWPTNGSVLSGSQLFMAMLDGYAIGQYDMYWRVDGKAWTKMSTSYESWPHKEAKVNVDSWSWSGTGPYRVEFSAREKGGKVIAERASTVFVYRPHLNLFPGARFYVDPWSNARQQADAWLATRPADAKTMELVAKRSQADWFGDWTTDIRQAVNGRTTSITAAGALPVYVAYNIPIRDCMGYSGGGAASAAAYRAWIRAFAEGIGIRKAAVVLEPDALAAMDCLSAADQKARTDLLRDAVRTLKARPGISVYIDAGNAHWQPAETMAARLIAAGVGFADGFALNVSNFHTTSDNASFGSVLSALVGGKHFVIDTSRNGLGGSEPYAWCNAAERGLGTPPTASTGRELVDAYLWIKRPGESDGPCAGGPEAGGWWADYALGLAQRMPITLATLP